MRSLLFRKRKKKIEKSLGGHATTVQRQYSSTGAVTAALPQKITYPILQTRARYRDVEIEAAERLPNAWGICPFQSLRAMPDVSSVRRAK
jgi:hypothetical protein